MDPLYRDEILEHYQNPLHFGKLPIYSISSRQTNPFCGDDIEIFIQFGEPNQTIEDIGFTGIGCAISIASASLLTDYIQGKTKTTVAAMTETDMMELLNISISETRKKCALLPFAVLQDCMR